MLHEYCCFAPQLIRDKVECAVKSGLKLVIVVGETLEQRREGRTNDVVLQQVAAFAGIITL